MIFELDETIRALLVQEGKLDPADVEVAFDIPNREWSSGISKPTINCYLFDIRENRELRASDMALMNQGTRDAHRVKQPMRVSLTYLITAWTRAVEDEHRLLFHTLNVLSRFPVIPDEMRQGALSQHQWPLRTAVIQPDGVLKSPGEFWTALENQLKPSLSYVVNLALDPDRIPAGPPVFAAGFRFHAPQDGLDQMLRFGGTVRDKQGNPVEGAEVRVEGHRAPTLTGPDGRYRLRVPAPGTYTLLTRVNGKETSTKIVVPEPEFDVKL